MAFCAKCGKEMDDGAMFCPSCGASVSGKSKVSAAQGSGAAELKADPDDAAKNKTMAILAYILFFIPLLTGDHNKSPFVKFHVNQGLVLFLAYLVYCIAVGILIGIFSGILIAVGAWALWAVIAVILNLLWIVPLILVILGIVNAATGKMKPLPIIGRFTLIK